MTIKANFNRIKEENAEERVSCESDMSQLLSVCSRDSKKGDAVMDFLAALARYDHECVVEGVRESGVEVMAVVGDDSGAVLFVNSSARAIPLTFESVGLDVVRVRVIDSHRTNAVVPFGAELLPLSIQLVECEKTP